MPVAQQSRSTANHLIQFVRDYYRTNDAIPLHAPVFGQQEKDFVLDTLKSTFVSSVGQYVDRLENDIAAYTRSPAAVATVNGTSALHTALQLVGVSRDDLVLTQPLSFVATCNAISYCGAEPIFIDIDRETLGLSPSALSAWLQENAFVDDEELCRLSQTRQKIAACVPMHTFGHPVDIHEIKHICDAWRIPLVEDAAESLGSLSHGRHTGTFGAAGILSFNGNKIITTGGGGMILCDETLAKKAKHLTTTAKAAHPYGYYHDQVGYNYRMPNLNAALGCAQFERLEDFVHQKRELAEKYKDVLKGSELEFVCEPEGCRSNYWLNAVICPDTDIRQFFLEATNQAGIMTRSCWEIMPNLPMYKNSFSSHLPLANEIAKRIINIPSSIIATDVA
jgi:aminotransferase in exopolysaccharide biosynthesis